MEIPVANNLSNVTFNNSKGSTPAPEKPANAFGIGAANQPEVQLSPQARILQQTEQNQAARNEAFQQAQNNNDEEPSENRQEISGNEFVRVSSSVGSSQRNNLTTDRATEVYRSIQALL